MKRLLFLFPLLLLFSCSKDDVPDSVKAGDYSGMYHRRYDTLVDCSTGTGFSSAFELDLDNNGLTDIVIISIDEGSGGMGSGPILGSMIGCLHAQVEILSETITDSIFLNICSDTVVIGNSVDIWLHSYTACERLDCADSIALKEVSVRYAPEVKLENELINGSGSFRCDTMEMTHGSFGLPSETIQISPDTTLHRQSGSLIGNCYEFPDAVASFIGCRIGDRFGWIKLVMIDNYRIFLAESAIQE